MHGVLRRMLHKSSVAGMTEFTHIAIPAAIADEVRRFAAFLLADHGSSAGVAASVRSDGIPDYPLWDDAAIIALANAGTATAAYYRKIMDAIIANEAVGQWVSLADLALWTEEKRSALSTFRTHLYRWVHAHVGKDALAPFTGASGQNLRPARGREVHYRVSDECAEQWARVHPQMKAI